MRSVGDVGLEEVNQSRTTSLCPGLTVSGNVKASGDVSPHERDEVDRRIDCEKN